MLMELTVVYIEDDECGNCLSLVYSFILDNIVFYVW